MFPGNSVLGVDNNPRPELVYTPNLDFADLEAGVDAAFGGAPLSS